MGDFFATVTGIGTVFVFGLFVVEVVKGLFG